MAEFPKETRDAIMKHVASGKKMGAARKLVLERPDKEWDFSEASDRLRAATKRELNVAPHELPRIVYLLRAIATELGGPE
jgi:hypothetical protein